MFIDVIAHEDFLHIVFTLSLCRDEIELIKIRNLYITQIFCTIKYVCKSYNFFNYKSNYKNKNYKKL